MKLVPFKRTMRSLPLIAFCFLVANALDIKDVVFVILSQSNKYHARLADGLREDLYEQCRASKWKESPIVHMLHADFPHVGGWTIVPLIDRLTSMHERNSSWIFFLQDNTHVNANELLNTLDKYNENDELWLGHALHDREATIIHHFAFYENPTHFKYPNVASGFAITTKLLQRLSTFLNRDRTSSADFSIDNAHELALFIWNNGRGAPLKHEPTLCISPDEEPPHCATYPRPFRVCGDPIAKGSIYFGVKTCSKFHNDRVPVVKNTWGANAHIIRFFSDVQDDAVPTINLGIPNTEQGHCSKTMAIIKYVADEINNDRKKERGKKNAANVKWIVLADDDTILSVHRLRELLSCYDDEDRIALGERYGYNVHGSQGYNYITGGGGIVLSRPLLEQLSLPGVCECPSVSSPDDMYLGICMAQLGVNITHSPLFHQARPMDYASEYLASQYPVSFHKHWMLDPIDVYKEWFANDIINESDRFKHNEL